MSGKQCGLNHTRSPSRLAFRFGCRLATRRRSLPGSRDWEALRPICAALAAARCWMALVGRNPGQEARAQELEGDVLSKLVYNPGGIGSRLKGTASLVVTERAATLRRAHLILPYTAETGREFGLARRVLHTFTVPAD